MLLISQCLPEMPTHVTYTNRGFRTSGGVCVRFLDRFPFCVFPDDDNVGLDLPVRVEAAFL